MSLNYRYSLPTADEIATSLLLIKKYKDQCHNLETRINDLHSLASESSDPDVKADFESMIQKLSTELSEVNELMAERGAFVSPIRRLPAELLGEVLVSHVQDHGHLPWPLLWVCRSWRYVALGTPRLWSRLYIRSKATSYGRSVPVTVYASAYPHGILCETLEMLELVLTRSGVVPLDITLEITTPVDDGMLDLLCNQAGPRWKSVKWDISSIPDFDKQWSAMKPYLKNLETVSIGTRSDAVSINSLLSTIDSTSSNLQALSIESWTVIQYLYRRRSLLRQIKHLQWQCAYSFPQIDTDEYARAAWLNLAGLQTLKLVGHLVSPFSQSAEIAYGSAYRSLKTLAMRSWHLEGLEDWAEKLHSLTHIHLEDISRSFTAQTPKPYSILLANVTHFTLVNETYSPLSFFSLPSLISLEVYGNTLNKNDANEELDQIWNPETFGKAPSPSDTFYFEPRANDAYLLVVLGFMNRIKELRLHYDSPASVGPKLLSALAVGPKKKVIARGPEEVKKWRAPTCPELNSLVIVCKKLIEKAACQEALNKISETRLGTASEMKTPELVLSSKLGRLAGNRASRLMENWVGHYDDD